MKTRSRRAISPELEPKLASYATAAAAVALAVPPAHASIVGLTINEPLVNGGADFTIDGQSWGLSGQWYFEWYVLGAGSSSHQHWTSFVSAWLAGSGGHLMRSPSDWPEMLNAGAEIGPSGKFTVSNRWPNNIGVFNSTAYTLRDYGPCAFDDCGPGYFGIQFTASGETHYGWILLNLTGVPCMRGAEGSPVTCFPSGEVFSYAYNTIADEGLTAGEPPSVPEPGTLGLLALGSLGLGFWRKRKTGSTVTDTTA